MTCFWRLARALDTISWGIQPRTAAKANWTAMPFQPVLPPSTRLIFSAIWGGGLRASMLIAASADQAGSADRRGVLETALVPEIVETPIDTERRACADIAVEHFAVIADGLHDAHHPILAYAELFTEIAIGTEDALQLRIFLFRLLVDVFRGHAELFGGDHGKQRPFHNVEPLVVAVAHHRTERLLRDDFREHHVIAGIGKLQAVGVQARLVGGEDVAAPGLVGLDRFVVGAERDHLVLHVVGLEVVGEILLGGGAGLDADRRAVKLERRVHLERLLHHETLPVIISHAGEVGAERGIARDGPGGVARQHVDFAGLQRREAVLGGERHVFDLGRIVEDRPGDRAADVDVKPGPVALVVRRGEAGQALTDTAGQHAPVLDGLERLRLGGLGSQAGGESESESQGYAFHGLWAFQSRLKVRNVVFAIVSARASRIKSSPARVMLENLADHPPIPGGLALILAERRPPLW